MKTYLKVYCVLIIEFVVLSVIPALKILVPIVLVSAGVIYCLLFMMYKSNPVFWKLVGESNNLIIKLIPNLKNLFADDKFKLNFIITIIVLLFVNVSLQFLSSQFILLVNRI